MVRRIATALAVAWLMVGGCLSPDPVRAEIAVTDLDGHRVVLEQPARRILIADGRFLMALALIHPDPVSLLVAWPHDIDHIGPATYARFRAHAPEIADLAKVSTGARVQSVERIVASDPDLVIVSAHGHLADSQRRAIEQAGIPVLTLDFFIHPLRNLAPSLRILGQVTGQEDRAEAFLAFRRAHMDAIADRLTGEDVTRPSVFLEPHAGYTEDCCNSVGAGNIGEYIAFAGGENIGAAVIEGARGTLNLEYVISRAPEVYIATGGPHMEGHDGVVCGLGYQAVRVRQSLARVVARPGIAQLPAVRNERAYGLSHQLLNSPLDILALEMLAKAIHPERFQALDPEATKQTISDRFLPIQLDGAYWGGLAPGQLTMTSD
ncbi:ABC transporter substrate-binding protein [Rhodovibrio salinarum]|uniref:ABC transporter substrate-binding protein n=1 Tax=Rhodovibrio salinarum TaxID=1087 RepID=A0A934V021_9PROT|nr:ABC transporter substrate-binding protein [Rhodovibrio salinarum]MBK1697782.1 ABC transporter substrate-binding protein [Rhodovibrio salinarum]